MGINAAALSVQANAYMDKDRVRPAQAAFYAKVMPNCQEILAKHNPQNAHGQAGGIPTESSSKLMGIMRANTDTKSHHWVKGLVAVYCALQGVAVPGTTRDVSNSRG